MGKDLNGKELGKGISQRKNGRYCARFDNRFGKRESIYGATLKEVKNKLAQAIADDLRRTNIVEPSTKLDDWYEMWMNTYKIPVIRQSTKLYYEHIYKSKISDTLGQRKLSEITQIQITALLNKIADNGYGWETLNKVRLLLIDMFNRALQDEFLVRNPAKGVRLPKRKPQRYVKALSVDDQEEFLICSSGTFYHNLFVVALNTGLRPGELFALTESDLDFTNNSISVTKTLLYQKFDGDEKKTFHMSDPKTYCSNRTVPMNSIARNALIKQIMIHKIIRNKTVSECSSKHTEFPDLIFTTRFGTPLNSELYCEAIERIVDEVNLTRDSLDKMEKFSGHAFRHTFATRCFEAGIPAKTVQSYLGHATLQMTMDLYTSVMEEKKVSDMYLLENYIGIEAPNISKYASQTA